jgi:hypothetical protein
MRPTQTILSQDGWSHCWIALREIERLSFVLILTALKTTLLHTKEWVVIRLGDSTGTYRYGTFFNRAEFYLSMVANK